MATWMFLGERTSTERRQEYGDACRRGRSLTGGPLRTACSTDSVLMDSVSTDSGLTDGGLDPFQFGNFRWLLDGRGDPLRSFFASLTNR